jgi:hypothetical protein
MDYRIINQFPIKDYLVGMGIYPARDKGYYGMYHSPFREDKDASLKVDFNKNLWIDFGSNEGGTLIDLVMRMENCSNGEAMRLLEQKLSGAASFSFHGNNTNALHEKERESVIRITNVVELNAPVLLDFLSKRGIDTDIAREYCKEVYYSVDNKPYYGIGFQNISGGYEIRNPYFKGCIPPKDISHIQQMEKKNTCYLFEGFMDYLSFITIRKKDDPQFPCLNWQDYIVLNSTANLPKALSWLAGYEKTHCFLDNDTAGRAAYKELEKELGLRVRDASCHYSEYKDLNDFLCGKKRPQVIEQNKCAKPVMQPPKKKSRGIGM